MKFSIRFFIVFTIFILEIHSQQDPHYTQYMYNTMSVNPAYAGSTGYGFISVIGRSQWLGLEGAPNTQNFSFDSSIGKGLGLGLNITNDVLGPSKEISLDGNMSYTIEMADKTKLAFGLRLGVSILDVDWSRGSYYQKGDPIYKENIHKVLPTTGSGIYYYFPKKWYIGFSIPNMLRSKSHNLYSSDINVESLKKMHFYTILGYVFKVNDDIKFKPASFVKLAHGAPLSVDFSANFYFYDKLNTGLSWRSGDAISALVSFKITESLLMGYAYDLTISNYKISNKGTHEVILQYIFSGMVQPRRLKCF